jgi:toxin-antitoxin system PIN domain toxin
VSAFLLDVNVLVALLWPAHEDHGRVQEWFGAHERYGWATCPLTQAAFVRIVSNPAFSPDAVRPQEASDLLSTNLTHSSHQFWTDAISFADAVKPFRMKLLGHRQVTDAYLLGLVLHRQARLATLDKAILTLLPDKNLVRGPIVLIG